MANPTTEKPSPETPVHAKVSSGFGDSYWRWHHLLYGKPGKKFDPLWDVPNPKLARLLFIFELFNFSRPAQARFSLFAILGAAAGLMSLFTIPVPIRAYALLMPLSAIFLSGSGLIQTTKYRFDGRAYAIIGICLGLCTLFFQFFGSDAIRDPSQLFHLSTEGYATSWKSGIQNLLLKLGVSALGIGGMIFLVGRRYGKAHGYFIGLLMIVIPILVLIFAILADKAG